jgi:hypothetical protein
MGAIRKPRFSDCDVEQAMDGFFNNLLETAINARAAGATGPIPPVVL